MANEEQKPEPRVVYVNDILIELDHAFPPSAADEMPANAFDGLPEPEGTPTKGN